MNKTPIALNIIALAALFASPAFAQTLEAIPENAEVEAASVTESPRDSFASEVSSLEGANLPQNHEKLQEHDKITTVESLAPTPIAAAEPQEIKTADSLYRDLRTEAKFLEPNEDDGQIAQDISPAQPNRLQPAAVELAQATPTQPVRQGFYGAISADWRFFNSVDLTGVNIPTVGAIGPISAEFNSGFGLNGSAGYKFPNNIRVEGQVAYGRNAIGDVNLPGVPAAFGTPVTTPLTIAPGTVIPAGTNIGGFVVPVNIDVGGTPLNPGTPPTLAQAVTVGAVTIPAGTAIPAGIPTAGGTTTTPLIRPEIPAVTVDASGSISTLSGLLNVYYDIDTQSNWEPYIGGGIGVSRLSANNLSVTYPGTAFSATVDDSTWGFVYQLMAGTAYYFNPRTAVTVGYRYFDTVGNNSFDTPLGEVNLEGVGVHNLEVGLRYFF